MVTQTRKKKDKIPANVVLLFMSENPEYLPTLENYGDFTIEEEIYRVRVTLSHETARLKRYTKMVKERTVPSISEKALASLVAATKQKKYRSRQSPPFSANELCGAVLKGNDKTLYLSKNGAVCIWVPSLKSNQ